MQSVADRARHVEASRYVKVNKKAANTFSIHYTNRHIQNVRNNALRSHNLAQTSISHSAFAGKEGVRENLNKYVVSRRRYTIAQEMDHEQAGRHVRRFDSHYTSFIADIHLPSL